MGVTVVDQESQWTGVSWKWGPHGRQIPAGPPNSQPATDPSSSSSGHQLKLNNAGGTERGNKIKIWPWPPGQQIPLRSGAATTCFASRPAPAVPRLLAVAAAAAARSRWVSCSAPSKPVPRRRRCRRRHSPWAPLPDPTPQPRQDSADSEGGRSVS